jgi:hypothetical protein
MYGKSNNVNTHTLGLTFSLCYLLESESGRRSTVATADNGAHTDNTGVDSARDTVVQLDVQLGDGVFFIDGSFLKIADGSSFYHVADGESLDGLVL